MIRSMIKKALGFERPANDPGAAAPPNPTTPTPPPAGGGFVQMGRKPGTAPREGLERRPHDMDVKEWYDKAIAENPVLIFMKGVPSAPACGFSAQVAQVFKSTGVPFQSYNILEDGDVRAGIKSINNWPTIPQIVVNGEFIGGCDIVMQMQGSGELGELLKTVEAS